MSNRVFAGLGEPAMPPGLLPRRDGALRQKERAAGVMREWLRRTGRAWGEMLPGRVYRIPAGGTIYRFQCQFNADTTAQFRFSRRSLEEDVRTKSRIVVFLCPFAEEQAQAPDLGRAVFYYKEYPYESWSRAWEQAGRWESIAGPILGRRTDPVITVSRWDTSHGQEVPRP